MNAKVLLLIGLTTPYFNELFAIIPGAQIIDGKGISTVYYEQYLPEFQEQLYQAIWKSDAQEVAAALKQGADPNILRIISSTFIRDGIINTQTSPLYEACWLAYKIENYSLEIIKILIQNRALLHQELQQAYNNAVHSTTVVQEMTTKKYALTNKLERLTVMLAYCKEPIYQEYIGKLQKKLERIENILGILESANNK